MLDKTYLLWDGSIPNNFLAIKIRKLTKKCGVRCTFFLYRRGLLGELHQTFPHDVSARRDIKN